MLGQDMKGEAKLKLDQVRYSQFKLGQVSKVRQG